MGTGMKRPSDLPGRSEVASQAELLVDQLLGFVVVSKLRGGQRGVGPPRDNGGGAHADGLLAPPRLAAVRQRLLGRPRQEAPAPPGSEIHPLDQRIRAAQPDPSGRYLAPGAIEVLSLEE